MITKERLDELLAYDPETGLFTWRVRRKRVRVGGVAGGPSKGHITICIDYVRYPAHRLAFLTMTGAFPPAEVDHINGVRDDNRWSNLRPATRAENGRNLRVKSNNTSGITGVHWDATRGRWCAQIKTSVEAVNLGRYVKFEDAVAARRAAEIKYHGEFSATTSRKILDAPPTSC